MGRMELVKMESGKLKIESKRQKTATLKKEERKEDLVFLF
jgi:hypothetical protein